jgi:hypothetical protein
MDTLKCVAKSNTRLLVYRRLCNIVKSKRLFRLNRAILGGSPVLYQHASHISHNTALTRMTMAEDHERIALPWLVPHGLNLRQDIIPPSEPLGRDT